MSENLPDPVAIAPDEAGFAAMFSDGEPKPSDPRGAAWLWWSADLTTCVSSRYPALPVTEGPLGPRPTRADR